MRCKKCGWISFDYLDICGKCGKSMEEEKRLLGHFVPDTEAINWFTFEPDSLGVKTGRPQADPAHHLSGMEISDLADDTVTKTEEEIALEEVELKRIAQDKDFQKALDEIAG